MTCYVESLSDDGISNSSLLHCLSIWGALLAFIFTWGWYYFKKREYPSRVAQALDDKHSVEVYWAREKLIIPFILIVFILIPFSNFVLLSNAILLMFGIFLLGGFYFAVKLLQLLLRKQPALIFTHGFIQLGESQFPWNTVNDLAIVAGPKAFNSGRNVFLRFSTENAKGKRIKKKINISYLDVNIDVLAENLRRFAEVDTTHWELYKPYFGNRPTDG